MVSMRNSCKVGRSGKHNTPASLTSANKRHKKYYDLEESVGLQQYTFSLLLQPIGESSSLHLLFHPAACFVDPAPLILIINPLLHHPIDAASTCCHDYLRIRASVPILCSLDDGPSEMLNE